MLRGFAAIVEAYLIYWAVVYFVARKWFGFSREWSAPLASGISICGVSAAIATGGAIRARPVVPVLVSSLVVVFAVVEVLMLPFLAQSTCAHEPLVAGAWMGLAVKTDGAAIAAGGITESLILPRPQPKACAISRAGSSAPRRPSRCSSTSSSASGPSSSAYIWTNHINVTPSGDKAKVSEIWQRFPKFILGFVLTFAVGALFGPRHSAPSSPGDVPAAIGEANTFRVIFFILTFFSIGVLSNFRSCGRRASASWPPSMSSACSGS